MVKHHSLLSVLKKRTIFVEAAGNAHLNQAKENGERQLYGRTPFPSMNAQPVPDHNSQGGAIRTVVYAP